MSRREFLVPIRDFADPARIHGTRDAFTKGSSGFRKQISDVFGRAVDFPDARPEPGRPDRYWQGFPWLTPIVGSGPLGLPSQFLAKAPGIPGAVVAATRDLGLFDETGQYSGVGQDVREWSHAFTVRLLEERIGPVPAQPGAEADGVELSDAAVAFVLLSAQLTRLYHRISLDTTRPISRWGTDVAVQDERGPRTGDTRNEYLGLVDDLVNLCKAAARRPRGERFPKKQLESLLDHVRNDAARGSVQLLHVQQLTEIAWNLLVEGMSEEPSYPGWTDLLLQLVLDETGTAERAHRRPVIAEFESIVEQIRKMYDPSSGHFWSDDEGQSRDSREFYDALARMLWAQHRVRQVEGKRTSVPYATAFVASFDLELELAMLRTATADATPFVVLVPMYLCHEDATDGEFVWLEAHIDPSVQTEGNIPVATKWTAVAPGRDLKARPDCPVIVRLVGAPWLSPGKLVSEGPGSPDGPLALLQNDLRELLKLNAGHGKVEEYQLVPAITIDEYQALLLSRDESVSGQAVGRGLPLSYYDDSPSGPQRYWALLGVPFQDPAVRARVLQVLTTTDGGGRPTTATREGAVPAPAIPEGPALAAVVPQSELVRPRGRMAARTLAPEPEPEPEAAAPDQPPVPSSTIDHETQERGQRRAKGVAVSRQVADDEIGVLLSLGLNVVLDRCEAFTDDLTEYAEWIQRGARKRV